MQSQNLWQCLGAEWHSHLQRFAPRFPISVFSLTYFSDRLGVFEGEQLVRGPSVRGNLWYCEQEVIFDDSRSCSRLNHRCLRPIVTTSSADCPGMGRFEDWLSLNHLASRSISVLHVYESGGPPESVNNLVCFNLPICTHIHTPTSA